MSNKERINRDKKIEEINRLLSVAGIPSDAQVSYLNHMVKCKMTSDFKVVIL